MKYTVATYRNFIFTGLLGLLFIPLFESTTHIKGVKKLEGATEQTDTVPRFSIKNWFDGNYQREEVVILNDSFGFRNIFVRIRNQIDYSLFGKYHARDVVFGKDGYLFDKRYIYGNCGTDFIGKDNITNVIEQLKFINDTLEKLNKTLILIIAPNKAAYYPEYLPDSFKSCSATTNYAEYIKHLKTSGLHYIDFNSYFIAQKNISKYPLMPKNGTHWSMYGATIAGDSLIRYIEKVRKIELPKADITYGPLRNDSTFDVDIENSFNLIFWFKRQLMEYPKVKFENGPNTIRPNVLIVGDSYYWGLSAAYNIENAFSDKSDFWYYFKKLEHDTVTKNELQQELAREDVIVLLATAHNWADIGWGFVQSTYNLYNGHKIKPEDNPAYIRELNVTMENIRKNKKWLESIVNGAKEKGIPLDSAVKLNAIWVMEHEKSQNN